MGVTPVCALKTRWKWWRLMLEGALANLLVLGSYWTYHKRRKFDRRVTELAERLESGMSLSTALWMTPAVASRETKLAVAVGEATGDLAKPLRHISSTRMSEATIEAVPRFAYIIILLFLQIGVVAFIVTFVTPKFEKIFREFND